ncbi:hypothetical protein EAS64_31990 [Trebonia kvetii]|uniref:Uncharacterized protein n=1 Tax=Trebonia kvetii TaxID=2480626 RepID=A0A6P2BPK2_9ACTN|nr:hypothetical protein [Trebonia kvetii]TVZ00952.1 hypothetical protein EAS64_31990 [Trebonia kvetii]
MTLKISEVRPAVPAAALLTIALLPLGAIAGCSSGAAAGSAGTSCGATRTGVNVPVTITVAKGTVDCATAMRVEREYAVAIRDGDLRGNGGGAPVTVDGWTCQAYPTPEVLRTGAASECHTTSAEVLAVLALPSTSASTTAGS